ncbi:hypothetical protein BDP81DRAFT_431794 [Colletotrichum phormii]|uniref:Uncharacterized protein n=1 Tax=Colletotrichum phormii TaxID=359342 RepID=A0AAJ0ED52_9PEZI|nr:uncharacterized protein BDP81DRAFT_431794 [Colletotrichum phormii]KAK1634689.1 hypothetical protein BDP81DRAFT_431794 [Colletotrichum phormii]
MTPFASLTEPSLVMLGVVRTATSLGLFSGSIHVFQRYENLVPPGMPNSVGRFLIAYSISPLLMGEGTPVP